MGAVAVSVRETITQLRHRSYSDFLMPSRLDAYRASLEGALAAGYTVISLERLAAIIGAGGPDPADRLLVLRHDIDTDPGTAAAMWAIDRDLGVGTSYLFRLSTLDLDLMAEISAGGCHASYHYEELATVAKRRGLRDRVALLAHLPEARDLFGRHVDALRARTGLPIRVVAAHGDFVNRRLGVANQEILADPAFRRTTGIDFEAYDEALLELIPDRYIDVTYPRYWSPADPAEAIARHAPIVQVLVHPRHWRVARATNARDDLRRLAEGLRFAIPFPRGG